MAEETSQVQDVTQAFNDVETAVFKVEEAVKDKWSTVQAICAVGVASLLWSLPGEFGTPNGGTP
jgi:hypothetical protein